MRRFENAAKAQGVLKGALLGSAALVIGLAAPTAASAQNCTDFVTSVGNLSAFGGFASAASSSVAASIGNVNTAFLAQQGSAFVAAPGNPPANSPGGGVWVRGVGGEVEIKSTSTSNVVFSSPTFPPAGVTQRGTVTCSNREHENFAGVQVGQDIARLNLDGWNLHWGTTAGYISSKSREMEGAGTARTNFEVPFIGTYAVATKDRFFADLMVRREFYNITLDNPTTSFFDQPFGARGISVTVNAGYQFPLQNNWFIEPSAGFVWSRTDVDPFNAVGLPPTQQFSGTVAIDDIKSEVGRATLRAGTSFTSGNLGLQPFASASVFHEFAGDVTSTFQTCPNCVFLVGGGNVAPASINVQTSSSRLGTWGQFSLGVAGQVLNTGWVGFVRGDYRVGDNIEGWTGNGGVRYHFTPEPPAAARGIFKAPPPPVVVPVNWTGFYVGGFFGGVYGKTDYGFVGDGGTDPRIAGWLGGGTAGFNYQVNQFVFGIEGDLGATNAQGTKTCGTVTGLNAFGVPVAFSPFFLTCSNDLDWIGTLAARVGLAWDRTLFYVKGGGAWTNEDVSAACIIGPNNVPGNARQCRNQAGVLINGFTVSDNRAGGVVGFGSEFALTPNWSAKAEYNYIWFGSKGLTASDGTLLNIRDRISEVKIGVNYHFGAAPAGVRY